MYFTCHINESKLLGLVFRFKHHDKELFTKRYTQYNQAQIYFLHQYFWFNHRFNLLYAYPGIYSE